VVAERLHVNDVSRIRDAGNAVSTRKVRDLLTMTLTFWTSLISLTMTPPEDTRRSAAAARSTVIVLPITKRTKARALAPTYSKGDRHP